MRCSATIKCVAAVIRNIRQRYALCLSSTSLASCTCSPKPLTLTANVAGGFHAPSCASSCSAEKENAATVFLASRLATSAAVPTAVHAEEPVAAHYRAVRSVRVGCRLILLQGYTYATNSMSLPIQRVIYRSASPMQLEVNFVPVQVKVVSSSPLKRILVGTVCRKQYLD